MIESDSPNLISILETAFSSSRCLNISFLDAHSLHPSGIDFESLRKTYDLILSLPSEKYLLPFVKSIEILIAKSNRNLVKLYNADQKDLRFLLILLENPLLSDRNHHDVMIGNISLILGNQHGPGKQILINWLSKYKPQGYQRILRIFQSYIVQHYHQANRQDESQLCALNFIRILFESNILSNYTLASISDFYLESLSSKMNFKEEYKLWNLMSDTHTRSKTVPLVPLLEPGFSYFNFPYLFDPVAKTRIMHIDAVIQMSHQFEDAFVHQALVLHAQRFLDDSFASNSMEKGLRRAANPFLLLEVNRLTLVDDVMNQLSTKGSDLKKPLKIRFVGGGEEGL